MGNRRYKDNPIGRSTSISTGATSTSASALTTTLAVVEHNVNADTLKKIESNKSLNTYVESMSDEELEAALIKFNLLDKSTSNTKEIIK